MIHSQEKSAFPHTPQKLDKYSKQLVGIVETEFLQLEKEYEMLL